MAKFFANLNLVLIVGFALAVLIVGVPGFGLFGPRGRRGAIGGESCPVAARLVRDHLDRPALLFQLRADPDHAGDPAELKPGVSKYIAPKALFYFRWGAAFTVLTGLLLAWSYGELSEALTLQPSARLIGIGMWLALIMAFNVWFDHLAEPEEGAGPGRGRRRGEGQGGRDREALLADQHAAVDPDAAGDDQRPLGRWSRAV